MRPASARFAEARTRVHRPALLGELIVVVVLVKVYDQVRRLEVARARPALHNANDVLAIERWLHLDLELAGNRWLIGHHTLLLIATGRAENPEIVGEGTAEFGKLAEAVVEVAQLLAQAIVRDGEGATKLITITVDEGATREECMRVGKAIGNSPLVKTAFFASDPNLGRILAAIGNAGIADLDPSSVGLQLGDVTVVERGGRAASYTEEQGKRIMKPAEISMKVTLGRGIETATVWTCDFSYDYVKINADYRS